MEIGQPSYRKSGFDAGANDEQLALNLDLIESFVTRPTCASLLTSNVLPSTTTLVCCPVPSDLEIRSCARFQWQPRTLPKVPSANLGRTIWSLKFVALALINFAIPTASPYLIPGMQITLSITTNKQYLPLAFTFSSSPTPSTPMF